MSKMTMPTVDVVRFHESDVIVASGLYLGKHADSNPGNGYYILGNNTYYTENGDSDFEPLVQALGGQDSERAYITLTNGSRTHIEEVFYKEKTDGSFFTNDGYYYWNSNSRSWAQ